MMAMMAEKSGDAFIDELEEIRSEWPSSQRARSGPRTREDGAAAKRRSLRGGVINNHAFIGEQYLNCPDKAVRRKQLQKIMDEGGQIYFGGPIVSHPLLAHWEANAYGLSDEEIAQLEQEDLTPENLVAVGWRISTTRHAPWPIAIGTSYVGEGGTYLRAMREPEKVTAEIEELRQNDTPELQEEMREVFVLRYQARSGLF
jgi:hypothetical protein